MDIDIMEVIRQRHSVRQYTDDPIEPEIRAALDLCVEECNEESGLIIGIMYDDPEGFDSRLAHYGKFRNVNNYIYLAGRKDEEIDERCGYYGEKLVLLAQKLGLNTCWAGMTFKKKRIKQLIGPGERLCAVIALGYGQTQGKERKSKTPEDVVVTEGNMPDWFRRGVEAALLAPTAMNQQKFIIGTKRGNPAIDIHGHGFFLEVDLGIVKYHFEVASGKKVLKSKE